MTLAEYHRVIAEYDRTHPPQCPVDKRRREREAERQERRAQEVKKIENRALTEAQWTEWFEAKFLASQACHALIEAIGQTQAVLKKELRKEYEAKFAAQEARIKGLESQLSLEAKFFELEHRLDARQLDRDESKRESEIKSEVLARIEKLQRQVDELKKVSAEPGPQGPPGPPGKLPRVKEYAAGRVHYESDVVLHTGALWQALGDTVHAPPHSDWICLARAGRNGSDGRSPNVCDPYDAREKYERLDIVALDGAAFIARRDNPGLCPSDGWQLLSKQGRPGHRGENGERGVRGEKGERGEPGATVVSWQLDRRRYRVSPLMSDGKVGPALELRALFEQYHAEAGE
jgi:hypothetical protein